MDNNEKIRFYEFNHKKHKNNILYINGIFFCFLFLILSIYLFYLASNKKVINKLSYKPISSVNYVTYYDDNEVNYDVYVSNMINKVINNLDKEKLNDLKNKYNLDYYLVIKPEININDIKQCLSLDDNIIEFLYLTKTHLDLDYYLYE